MYITIKLKRTKQPLRALHKNQYIHKIKKEQRLIDIKVSGVLTTAGYSTVRLLLMYAIMQFVGARGLRYLQMRLCQA